VPFGAAKNDECCTVFNVRVAPQRARSDQFSM
jgi:hypothetical protein